MLGELGILLGGLGESKTLTGWTVGGGMEVGLTPHWSARVEYLFIDFGDRRYALTGPGTVDLREGDQVTVTGRPRPELVSPCGSIFVVSAVG